MDFGDPERAWRQLGAVKPIAIVLSLALLAVAWLAPVPEGLGRPAFAALLTTAASLPLMLAEVLPSYVVTIMLAAGLVMPGIVAPSVALSGFASNSWLMIVVLFSVSSAIAKSGLMYRPALLMLHRLPGNLILQSPSRPGLHAAAPRRAPPPRGDEHRRPGDARHRFFHPSLSRRRRCVDGVRRLPDAVHRQDARRQVVPVRHQLGNDDLLRRADEPRYRARQRQGRYLAHRHGRRRAGNDPRQPLRLRLHRRHAGRR